MMSSSRLFSFFLVLICIALLGCSSAEQKKEKHYSRAMEYLEIDDKKAAKLELRNAIKIDPKYADARYQLGLLHLDNSDPRAAFGELKRVANLDPKNLDAAVKVAEFFLIAQKKEESRDYISKVLQEDPEYIDALALLANLELIDGNFPAAEEALDKATADGGDSARFSNIRGRIYTAQEKFEEGEKMFLKAIELGPQNFTNYRTLYLFYIQQKRLEEAGNILQKAVTAFPDNSKVYVLLANFHKSSKEYSKAEAALMQAAGIEPENEALHLALADLYKTQLQYKKAEDYLTGILIQLPESLAVKSNLANMKFDLKKIDEARLLTDEVLTTSPTHGAANLVKAKITFADGKTREAIDLLSSLTTNYPKWSEPQYYLALCHLKLGEMELARQASGMALQLSPASSRLHTLQSQIHLTLGQSQDAGKEANIALRLDPRNVAAARLMAKALLYDKRYDEAIELITLIQEKVPNDIELIGSLGLAHLGKEDTQQAKSIFSDLLNLSPGNERALALLASLTAKEDLNAAITVVEKQIGLAPEISGHYALLGDLLLKSNQPDNALQAFAKAQELAPNNPKPYIIRARVMHALGKTDEAIKEFQTLLQSQPQSIPAHLGIATLFEAQKDFTMAKDHYATVLKLRPDQPAAANNLAYIIAQEEGGDLGEALRLAMLAKQAHPDDPSVADTLGMVHYMRDSYGLAKGQFQQALASRPEDPTINYHMALAQFADGEKETALVTMQKALSSTSPFGYRVEAEKLLQQWQNQ